MATTVKLVTAEDLWEMPTDEPWEVWEGELRKVPVSGGRASGIAGKILVHLNPADRLGHLGLVTGADGTYILARNPDTVVVPDVGFVRWDRLPDGEPPTRYIPVAPDLAIEVRSPTDEAADIARKLELYRRARVPLLWWVFPATRTVAVYQHGVLIAEVGEDGALDGGDVLPGVQIPVATIFGSSSRARSPLG